ncbi:uncharacterized protein LOC106156745 [Lingula anatina]|uniref:Uncharacterized protein LOC106156745 n=1 Tax=Lingula anatina TaxID=7574 RepID=A0A1S3HNJ0_LINAN|nr:uncharacterized protein LOC106156745 [Lingula anatina]|eukprot:XP_013387605.1 uncharacterized protein LOC106156745 [Lingula anatina]
MTMFSAMGIFQVYLALAYDIPMNTMAIEMQWLHGGEFGIDCWMCSKDSNCSDVEPLSLVSPLKIFSDDQNERAAAELWLTLGLSSLSTFIDLISVTNPYFVSVTLYYFLCCASGSNDAAGRYFLTAYYAFWGILAGVHVQMTNLTLLDRHLLPQGDYPWEFKSTITILMVISFVASYMDCLLTFFGCCRWCDGSKGSLTRRIAYPLFIWNLVFFAMNIAKTTLPISHPKESYITVVAIGGGFILFWMGLISILLIFLCCGMDDAIRSLGRLVQVDDSSNRVHP